MLKKLYYQMKPEDFKIYLNNLKNYEDTIHIGEGKYFFHPTNEVYNLLLKLHHLEWDYDFVINSFSCFGKRQLIQESLINDILATNEIEKIYSTHHDIYSILNNLSCKIDKSSYITRSYKLLLDQSSPKVNCLSDIKTIYMNLLSSSLEDSDLPDGIIFRKEKVYISNGVKNIIEGVYPEDKINSYLNEFINIYNDSKLDIYLRLIIAHYLFEITHPFYDGNGRLGRFLFSNKLYEENNTYSAFLISSAFNENIHDYYKAFENVQDFHEYGCINDYVIIILKILISKYEKEINVLKSKKNLYDNYKLLPNMSNKEAMIDYLLFEASITSNYGICVKEILNEIKISRRMVIYILNKFKDENSLLISKVNNINYYKKREL